MVLKFIPLDISKYCNKYKLNVVDKFDYNLLKYFEDIYPENWIQLSDY